MRRPRSFIGPSAMGGMVSLWGASSLIKSVQRGTVTIVVAATSGTATVTSVSLVDTSIELLGYRGSGNVTDMTKVQLRLELTNATTVTAYVVSAVDASGGNIVAGYDLIEYAPGVIKSVQRGVIDNTTATATITAVNPDKSSLKMLGWTQSLGFTTGDLTIFPRLDFTNATTLTKTSAAGASFQSIAYQVVESY